jgi:hypothetical protein
MLAIGWSAPSFLNLTIFVYSHAIFHVHPSIWFDSGKFLGPQALSRGRAIGHGNSQGSQSKEVQSTQSTNRLQQVAPHFITTTRYEETTAEATHCWQDMAQLLLWPTLHLL